MYPIALTCVHETVHAGGEDIACTSVDLFELVGRMSRIHDVEHVHSGCGMTSDMMALVQSFERLSIGRCPVDDSLNYSIACCDISDAFERVQAKYRVLAGISAGGGTLYLAFVRKHVELCTVEAICDH